MYEYNINHTLSEMALSYSGPDGENILSIGRNSYCSIKVFDYYDNDSPNQERGRIEVGHYSSLAGSTKVFLYGNHNLRSVAMGVLTPHEYKNFATPQPPQVIRIGNDVWIGDGVTILNNAQVGDGAVVAAGTVVTGSVPPYAVLAGNPGRIVKYRFSEEQIAALLQIRWWDWPYEKVLENLDLLRGEDIDKFIAAHRP